MKKQLKKAASLLLAFVMVFALGTTAFASDYTITIQNATIKETYSAYKIFDATYNDDGGVSYTISTSSALYGSIADLGVFDLKAATTDANTYYVTVKDGVTDAQVIAAIESLDIENLVTASASAVASETTFTLDVGEPGYYYVTTTTGSTVTIDTAHPTATIIDKNEIVGENFHKYIVDENGNLTDYGDAALGDELNFDITSDVPRYEGSDTVYEYQFTDTLSDSGMEIEISASDSGISQSNGHYYASEDLINQFVTFTDSSSNTYKLSDVAYNYTLEFTDVTYDEAAHCYVCGGFILTYYTYEDESLSTTKYPTDLTIDITYTTYVTDNANHFEANTAVMNYWVMGPGDVPVPGTNTGRTSTDYVYDWDLKILKEDGTDSTKLLEGATFTLYGENLIDVNVRTDYTYTLISEDEMEAGVTYYYLTIEGRYITTAPTDATSSQYDPEYPGPYVRTVTSTEVKEAGEDHVVEGTTNSEGEVIFDGLTEGTYTITEIVAPDGYNLLDNSITIEVAFDSENGTFSVTSISGLADGAENVAFDVNDELEITILNNSGSLLPGTGGMGTYLFYIIGAIVICGAAIALVMRRRNTNAEA